MTRVVCAAVLHEHLVEIPPCDLLLIAGDVSFAFKGDLRAKHAFLAGAFKDWLERVHPASGRYRLGETEIVNASVVDNEYQPVNPVVELTL